MSTKNSDLIQSINNMAKQNDLSKEDKLVLIENYVTKMETNSKEKKKFDEILTKCKNPENCITELKKIIIDLDYDKISTNNSNIVESIQNIIKGTITKLDRFNLTIIYINKLESSDEKKELNKIIKDPETCSTEDPNACIKAIDEKTTEYINAKKAAESEAKAKASEKKTTQATNAATSAAESVQPIQKTPE